MIPFLDGKTKVQIDEGGHLRSYDVSGTKTASGTSELGLLRLPPGGHEK